MHISTRFHVLFGRTLAGMQRNLKQNVIILMVKYIENMTDKEYNHI